MTNIDWGSLPFGYIETDSNIRCTYKNGAWGELEQTTETTIPMHISAACLHYGFEIFEGLKAFRGEDGKVRLFRPDENAKRFNESAHTLCMAELPEEIFIEACEQAIKANERFVPPYGTGASLYLRPFMVATEAKLGVAPATEFLFCVFVSPVGPYFKGGIKPINVVIDVDHDRAAPRGTGRAKCGGNYAASIYSMEKGHKNGYSNVLYVDAESRQYIEECGAANFFGIKDNTYVTPESPSILESITNKSLRVLAEDMGMKVERRHVAIEELDTFEECGACGTAAVISPIGSIFEYKSGKSWNFGEEPGAVSLALYQRLQDIQHGRVEDKFGWCVVVE